MTGRRGGLPVASPAVPATRSPRYEVVGLLGRGASAVVELAVAPDGTRIARKRLAAAGSAAEIEVARARLRREAELLGHLRHPAIVPVLAVETTADGELVLVMPALACSLADRVRTDGPLPTSDVLRMGGRLLGALAAAHRAGVVHRDIKPGNVLLDHWGHPALADFGMASTPAVAGRLTAAGVVVGTPAWMAPEQARGHDAGPPADVFALGATLLFAATGATPWGDADQFVALARAASGARPMLPRSLPARLAAPLAAMLDPDPTRRPSAAALLGGVAGTLGGPPAGPAGGTGPEARPPRPRSHRRRRAALPAALVAVVAAGLVATVTLEGRTAPPRAAAAQPPARPAACTPLPYQPCGQPPAPGTDGRSCLPGAYDLDGSAADGCEARSDWRPGATVGATGAAATVRANVVPPSAADTFTTRVSGHVGSLCGGAVDFRLVAPAGAADELTVTDASGARVTTATSADGQPATASVHKPGCFGSHSETLTLTVRTVVGASAADFTLERSGGW